MAGTDFSDGQFGHVTNVQPDASSRLTEEISRICAIQPAIGDVQVSGSTNPTPNASRTVSHEVNQIGMNGFVGGAARVAITTIDGAVHLPYGLYDAGKYELQHPVQMLETVAGSAAFATALKFALPEAGPVGKIAGIAMGAWFVGTSAPGFVAAYKTGLNANTWSEMNQSGQQWGDAAGTLGVNAGLGYVGFRIGAGVSGNILARESFDKFADVKQNFWDGTTDRVKGLLRMDTSVPTASSVGLKPNFVIDGDKVKLLDSLREAPAAKVVGPADLDAAMNATVMLKSKASVLGMDRYLARMSQNKASMLSDVDGAYEKRFGASQQSLDAISDFAKQHNLSIAEADLRSGKVLLTGRTGDFQNAFSIDLLNYASDEGVHIGHTQAVSLPKELAPHVRAVLGTDERAVATSSYRVQTMDSPGDGFVKQGGYLATEIARAQNFPLRTGGEGQSGAFISLSGGIDLADYNKFFPDHGLEQPRPLGIIEVDGAKNAPGTPHGGDTENVLDAVQMQSIAPKAQVDMVLGPNSDQGFADVFERSIFPKNGEAQKSVISTSWGLGESKQSPQALNTLSIAFRQAAIRGVQIFAGAGDNGARSNSTSFQPEFPASDPNVTGVGGLKMILGLDGKASSVTTWDEGENSSTGGGVSKIFKLPIWQQNSNVPNNLDTGLPGRGVPDISTNAAKATGFPVRVGGQNFVIGGTSAGAPLYAGLMLNINSELAALGLKPVTPLNPWLYSQAQSNIFHDVLTGGNHGYKAGKGWDPVSGLGWIDGQEMLNAMIKGASL
jgi:kumamolisin